MGESEANETVGFLQSVLDEIIKSPINLALIGVIALLVYKIIKTRIGEKQEVKPPEPELPKLRRDFTVKELREYDGNQKDGRVLIAVNGNVYDVTKGKRFYGPGGPYAAFGGRDASRGLATFSVTSNDNLEYDDLKKYDLVGKLLRPGEEPTHYSDEEEDSPNDASTKSTIGTTDKEKPE
uniref:CSON001928 protein n=1 Tax=Culicoides sonorensis TaxID=179676 RepID=A0A336MQC6_CULSO